MRCDNLRLKSALGRGDGVGRGAREDMEAAGLKNSGKKLAGKRRERMGRSSQKVGSYWKGRNFAGRRNWNCKLRVQRKQWDCQLRPLAIHVNTRGYILWQRTKKNVMIKIFRGCS